MKVQKTIMRYLVLLLTVLVGIACKKEINVTNSGSPNRQSTENVPLDAVVVKEVANALEQVYASDRAVAEVEAAINSGYYLDERVLLRDLLFPENSLLYSKAIFKSRNIDTGVFRDVFFAVIINGAFPKLKSELSSFLKPQSNSRSTINALRIGEGATVLSATNPIAIYFPYSENFPYSPITDPRLSVPRKPTIVAAESDADSARGRAPFYCHSGPENTCYRDVPVNDDYAYVKPTHIITTGADVNPGVSLTPLPNGVVSRVYHGTSRLTRQMDKLISLLGNGGGSEIKICRVNGYLKRQDEHIDDFAGDVVTVHYTRGEIRNRRWKRVYSVWDPNWNYQDFEQIYAVYEEDTKGTKTVDGTLRTSLTIPGKSGKVEGDIGFKIQVSTQDEIITQRKIDRKSYFYDALNNQGWGFVLDPNDFLLGTRDWPIYDGGSIWQYTFPYRVY